MLLLLVQRLLQLLLLLLQWVLLLALLRLLWLAVLRLPQLRGVHDHHAPGHAATRRGEGGRIVEQPLVRAHAAVPAGRPVREPAAVGLRGELRADGK